MVAASVIDDFVTIENVESRWTLAEQRFLEVFFGEDVILRTRHRRHQRRSPTKVSFNLAANIRYDFHAEPKPKEEDDDDESRPPSPVKRDPLGRIVRPRTAELSPDLQKRLESFRELDSFAFIKPGTAASRQQSRRSGSSSDKNRRLVALSARSNVSDTRSVSPTRAASAFAFERLRSHKPAVESVDAGYALPRRRRPLSATTKKMLVGVVKDALKKARSKPVLHGPLEEIPEPPERIEHSRSKRTGIHYYLHPPAGIAPGLSLRKHSFGVDHPFGDAVSEVQLKIPKQLVAHVERYHRLLSPSKGSKPRIIVRDILKTYNIPKPPRLGGRLTPCNKSITDPILERIMNATCPANTAVFSEDDDISERNLDDIECNFECDDAGIEESYFLRQRLNSIDRFIFDEVAPPETNRKKCLEDVMRDVGWIFPLDYFFDQEEIEIFIEKLKRTPEGIRTLGVVAPRSKRILSLPTTEKSQWRKLTVVSFNEPTRTFNVVWDAACEVSSSASTLLTRCEFLLPTESIVAHNQQTRRALALRSEFEKGVAVKQCVCLLVSFFSQYFPPFPVGVITKIFEEIKKAMGDARKDANPDPIASSSGNEKLVSFNNAGEDNWPGFTQDQLASGVTLQFPLLINELRDEYFKSLTKANIMSSYIMKPLILVSPPPRWKDHSMSKINNTSRDSLIAAVRNAHVLGKMSMVYELCEKKVELFQVNCVTVAGYQKVSLKKANIKVKNFVSATKIWDGLHIDEYKAIAFWLHKEFQNSVQELSQSLLYLNDIVIDLNDTDSMNGKQIPSPTPPVPESLVSIHAHALIVNSYRGKLMEIFRELRDNHICIIANVRVTRSKSKSSLDLIGSLDIEEDLERIKSVILECYSQWLSDLRIEIPLKNISIIPENHNVYYSLMSDLLTDSLEEIQSFLRDRLSMIAPLLEKLDEISHHLALDLPVEEFLSVATELMSCAHLIYTRLRIHNMPERRGIFVVLTEKLIQDIHDANDRIKDFVMQAVMDRLVNTAKKEEGGAKDAEAAIDPNDERHRLLSFLEGHHVNVPDEHLFATFHLSESPEMPSDDDDSMSEDESSPQEPNASWSLKSEPPPPPPVPNWSKSGFTVVRTKELVGDRMKLSPDVLEQILSLAGSNPLPSPLVFELVSTNRSKLYGSVREFTCEEEGVVLVGDVVADGLLGKGVDEGEISTIKLVVLPKCEYLKLAPLEENYLQIKDIRATLEAHLRRNYATICEGETLTVMHRKANSSSPQENHFLITEVKPARACTCIDVDINLDIVPLDATLAEKAVKLKHQPMDLSSSEGELIQLAAAGGTSLLVAERQGTVAKDETVIYKLPLTQTTRNLKANVEPLNGDADLFVSTTSEVPSLRYHQYMDVSQGVSKVHFEIEGDISETPFISFAIHGYAPTTQFRFRVEKSNDKPIPPTIPSASATTDSMNVETPLPDSKQCDNCFTWIPTRTFSMHQAFCFRNNAVCRECKDTGRIPFVFKKEEFAKHWHCTECWKVSNELTEREKHMQLLHTPIPCDCALEFTAEALAEHRRNACPERLIICRFCRLRVRAGPPSSSAKDRYIGGNLSEHESECGGRTIPCAKCNQNVQLKDVPSHAKYHDFQRRQQPNPKLCPNSQCSNTPSEQFSNVLGMCQSCFKPFWSARHDPQNQKLAGKLLGAYHSQLTAGCGKEHCKNKYCATSSNTELLSAPLDPNEAAVHAFTLLKKSALFKPKGSEYDLCVTDATNASRRYTAENLTSAGYHVSWCVKALVECKDNASKAVDWLMANAAKLDGT
ncbi:hypothetical protein HDU97_001009 [Phlyctochytrium planicorne]|nr:hypothetical protein HDU97_001009 [Phlyctochytrium planicorne]